jgi:7-cyano-7-deazaguanine synthase in queuosine biosynthesis
MKTLVSLSGGLDSATLLGFFKEEGMDLSAVSFYYGSKHNKYENEAAIKIAEYQRRVCAYRVVHGLDCACHSR